MRIDFNIADKNSVDIKNYGAIYTEIELISVSGSNTSSCRAVNEIYARIVRILSAYREDVLRDGENIKVLATDFKELDRTMADETSLY